MKKNILKIALAVVIMLSTQFIIAQGGPPGIPPGGSPGGPPGFPIDGGIILLSAVAFGYGIKKIKNKQ